MSDDAQATAVETDEDTGQKVEKRTKRRRRSKRKRQPKYNVVLWNDEDHTYEYVIEMMIGLFAHSPEKGFLIAHEVDTAGRAIVLTTTMEHAELKRDQIHSFGKDRFIEGCKGSMWASIEACDG